ncbi:hypothetical protein KEJ45_04495 [Candidatus Bathyarchaeota archaeon]|nr:hypothetical protein [Candidatus Bathyarchaeota archaeon]
MKKIENKIFSFAETHKGLTDVLLDHKLASLGDAYVNFVYSLALSEKKGQPFGAKVRGSTLSEALKKAGLRTHMPSRVTSHMLADAAEALIVYAWLHKSVTIEECVKILREAENFIEGFACLLLTVLDRITF